MEEPLDPGVVDYSQSGDTPATEHDEEDELAQQSTRYLRGFRLCMTFVMVVMAVGLACGIYFLTSNSEEKAFEAAFEGRTQTVIDSLQRRSRRKVTVLQATSFATTSYANYKNATWPFVTIPDFVIKAASTRALAQNAWLSFHPRVVSEDRANWEAYSLLNREWVEEAEAFEAIHGDLGQYGLYGQNGRDLQEEGTAVIWDFDDEGNRVPVQGDGPFYPVWQMSPVKPELINYDFASSEYFNLGTAAMEESNEGIIGRTELFSPIEKVDDLDETPQESPILKMHFPVFDELDPSVRVSVGMLATVSYWDTFMENVLAPNQGGLYVILNSDCGKPFTFYIPGNDVEFVGEGDLHDRTYDDLKRSSGVFGFIHEDSDGDIKDGIRINDICNYIVTFYPSSTLEDEFTSAAPWYFFGLVLAIFALTVLIIYFYDWKVEKNYQETYRKAKQAGAIVSSIFPAAVRKRLYEDDNSASKMKGQGGFKQAVPTVVDAQKTKLKGFLTEDDPLANQNGGPTADESNPIEVYQKPDKAIADLFPNTTILFADIVGFTPWSSQREPGEVFTLLQTLYQEFDSIARMLKVFKVETIGDCYVAATGLPEPQPDHALRMARFATKIMNSMNDVTRQLEIRLGPDTGELRIRVGMHSGPVTAGVLRGTKGRFQLFGDTMNFAARMEHHSLPSHIQCSELTANLIREAGKEHWLRPREDKVKAKGKGELQTYWIVPKSGGPSVASSDHDEDEMAVNTAVEDDYNNPWSNTKLVFDLGTPGNRYQRLIDWNVELLAGLLKQIEAQRRDLRTRSREGAPTMELKGGSTALDEVTEIITLPQFKQGNKGRKTKAEDVELSIEVITQLRDYVTTIASMYRDNPFHNFEHASHVTMSTNKLLKRVTIRDAEGEEGIDNADLHNYTYGITSDPLTQFTLVFCALVHDVDHAGVSNFQLIQEGATIAKLYKNKSVAEQNSVDLAWDLLMDPNYKELQKAIYANEDELKRFRQLMVNIVLATDIFDVDMKAIRERRWGKAFQYEEEEEQEIPNQPEKALERDYNKPLSEIDGANLKATIVMEHLIQASDVAHTMQHWAIYLKWNERLFCEMYSAFENGRAVKDPSVGWYEGEIMFFDKYVIPLAKKLDDCGVFGVSSDECLNYAAQNRKQWAIKGDELVGGMLERYQEAKAAKNAQTKRASTGH